MTSLEAGSTGQGWNGEFSSHLPGACPESLSSLHPTVRASECLPVRGNNERQTLSRRSVWGLVLSCPIAIAGHLLWGMSLGIRGEYLLDLTLPIQGNQRGNESLTEIGPGSQDKNVPVGCSVRSPVEMKLLRLQGSLYGADEWVSRFTGESGGEGRETFQCCASKRLPRSVYSQSLVLGC